MVEFPQIPNTPGLTWKRRKVGYEARWQARSDLVKRGFTPKSARIWAGEVPSELDVSYIQDRCQALQSEMLVWGRGGIPQTLSYDGTFNGLIDCYQTDPDSSYRKLRFKTREFYENLCKRVRRDMGSKVIAETKARDMLHWHEEIMGEGKIPMAHAVMGMVRTLATFGMTMLEDDECARLSAVMGKMRFQMPKSRNERLTAGQATMIRAEARKMGFPSIALAQAIQFEFMLRQKDVIGEWVPLNEPGISAVVSGPHKWLRGIRWEEIDQNLILTHITSKRQKEISVDLKLAPMVMEELDLIVGGWNRDRASLPASGAIINAERHGRPWTATEFRRHWRKIATEVGIPKEVRNMDSRAGAISEATDAGADLEHVRQSATHSDIAMTQKYSRGSTEKIAGVMKQRVAFRSVNKPGS